MQWNELAKFLLGNWYRINACILSPENLLKKNLFSVQLILLPTIKLQVQLNKKNHNTFTTGLIQAVRMKTASSRVALRGHKGQSTLRSCQE